MAEGALFSLATSILELAGSINYSEIRLVCGARDELDSLKETVETIRFVLLDAEKQQWHNLQVNHWLKKLKNVLYDVEDLLDDVATEDLRRKVTSGNKMSKEVCFFFSKSNQLAHRLKVANKIRELRKKLDRIKNDKDFNLVPHLSVPTIAIVRRRTHSYVREEEITGRENDKGKIIWHLFGSSSTESVSVVSIVGMGGLGKTTLARMVFNDEEVKKYFELRLWVCVSEVFDEDLIIKEILKSAQDECQGDPEMRNLQDIESKSEDQLQRLLRHVLDGKRYLLVLDDLWNEDRERWSELRCLLMGGSRGSKILVTTRNQSVVQVVQATDANSVIHDLHVLSEAESWDLFKKTAFRDGRESLNQKLEEIGRDIVKKCGGVPLAIKAVGNLLSNKKENEWLLFKERELSKINELNPKITEVLKLSYNHLPPGLKQCFAYCALFPKDYVFDKQTMIQLWMAQGFIKSLDGNEELDEIGDSYVSYLLCRSFLEVEKVDRYTGEATTFKMHDLMHDLAVKVAGNECKMVSPSEGGIHANTRHASFALQSSSLQEVTSLLEATNLRTFLTSKSRPFVQNLSPNEYHGIFSKYRHWRTLALGYADFCIPSSLGSRLKHLRFLDVSRNRSLKSLPDSITDLLNLQTLKLSGCENLKTFPRDLRKLVNLRHLVIHGCYSLRYLPPLSELPSLRRLILVGLYALEFLQHTSDPEQYNTTRPFFPCLEKLSLIKCSNLKGWRGKRQIVGACQKNRSDNSQSFFPKLWSVVILGCPHLNFVPPFPQVEYLHTDNAKMLEQQLMADPNCQSEAAARSKFIPFSKLKYLQLADRELEPSMLETLLRLASNLESMSLYRCKVRSLSRCMQYLSSLQELKICACEELDLSCQEDKQGTQWRFLAKLRVLKITQLSKLVALPDRLQHITTLQHLEISHCTNLVIFPKWISKLTLLEELILSHCPSLMATLDDLTRPASLKKFTVFRCPALEKKLMQLVEGHDKIHARTPANFQQHLQ